MAQAKSKKSAYSSTSTTKAARTTRKQNAEGGFTASATLIGHLQQLLVDVIELTTQGKQAHWNVVGPNFRDTHLVLDELVADTRTFSDDIAERMRALHGIVDGRSGTVSATTSLEPFPAGEVSTADAIDLITARIDATVGTARGIRDEVDEEDPVSADLLHGVIERLEQLSWLIAAENRTPA